ncbi:MAG: TMEM175 family protein [Bacteroidetes bacterium]|nr:TMEM175 family protein [Bacteroidota bacterium]
MDKIKKKNPLMNKDRLEMFSDGVFAIAITLLVLEIKIPNHEDLHKAGGLYQYLFHLWPSFLSYALGFIFIGIYWSNHHHLFNYVIKKTDHVFNLINVIFLMTIAFMPFSTAILGEYVMEKEYMNAAVTTYCIGLFFPVPMVGIMFLYAFHKKKLIDPKLSNAFIRKQILKLSGGLVTSLTAIAFSFSYPIVSICITGFSFLLYLMPPDMPEYDEEAGG